MALQAVVLLLVGVAWAYAYLALWQEGGVAHVACQLIVFVERAGGTVVRARHTLGL